MRKSLQGSLQILDPDFGSIFGFCYECVGPFHYYHLKFTTFTENFIIKSWLSRTCIVIKTQEHKLIKSTLALLNKLNGTKSNQHGKVLGQELKKKDKSLVISGAFTLDAKQRNARRSNKI